ncbi:hypothetical protein PICST_66320 [Scheffersomyces stipitis CBS 6054]|uniref:UBA domain-containing protein n=1 Tax=Scheffersomyces stipitis (strain ATCC 58785 / CBS 6054 / NBRC 10063 / NRRL Y-11545) TaxID=322104 RepID=A3GFH0_PICST|nr:predicted protein [Scheffersomyces stipitis CBS 6054]EAZ63756.2 hypothetical protein PICST_66320 [Scheffersomyces stipitis CBS 6054]
MESEKTSQLMEMGFSESEASEALVQCDYDLERAIAFLFGDPTETPTASVQPPDDLSSNLQMVAYHDTVGIRNPEDIPNFSDLSNANDSDTTYNYNNPRQNVSYNNHNKYESSSQSHENVTNQNVAGHSGTASGTLRNNTYEYDRESNPDNYDMDDSEMRYAYGETIYARVDSFARSKEGPPSVLVGSAGYLENYIVPLIVIAAQIDRFSQLVLHDTASFDSSYEKNWYNNFSELTVVVPTEFDEPSATAFRFISEIQRVVAFLTPASQRSFMTAHDLMKNLPGGFRRELGDRIEDVDDLIPRFYHYLNVEYQKLFGGDNEFDKLFESQVESVLENVRNESYSVPIDFESRGSNLFESLASIFWHDEDTLGTVRFVNIAPILTIQLAGDDDGFMGEPFQVEEEFYPEVFSSKYSDVITEMVRKRLEIMKRRTVITQEIMSYNSFEGKKIKAILQSTIGYLEKADSKEAAIDLSTLTESIRDKSAELTAELNSLSKELSTLDTSNYRSIVSRISGYPEVPPLTKYLLVGVICSDTEYFFRSKVHAENQGWVYFNAVCTSDKRVVDYSVHSMDFNGVYSFILDYSKNTSRQLILIYATEEEVQQNNEIPIVGELKNFFDRDNEVLQDDIKRFYSDDDDDDDDDEDDDDDDDDVAIDSDDEKSEEESTNKENEPENDKDNDEKLIDL